MRGVGSPMNLPDLSSRPPVTAAAHAYVRGALILLLCVGASWTAIAQTPPATSSAPAQQSSKPDTVKLPALSPQVLQEMHRDLDGIVDDPTFANAQWGVVIQSLETGEYLYKRNENKLFLPASNLKLFTSAAALEYLGTNFRYSTTLLLNGEITGHVANGDIVIRGAGDPTWSKRFSPDQPLAVFERWADSLEEMGVTTVTGNIIGDDSYFDGQAYAPGWSWDDQPYYYCAQTSALVLNENCVDLKVVPAAITGAKAIVSVFPNTTYVTIINEVKTTRSDSVFNIDVHREPGTNLVRVTGNIPLNYSEYTLSATVDNPALYAATVFRETLAKRGIEVKGTALTSAEIKERLNYPQMKILDVVTSEPLPKILEALNVNSINLFAEILLKTIAKERTGEGSFAKGAEMVKKYLSQIGISPEHCNMVDGSGLSRLDLVTPMQMATLLRVMRRSDKWKPFFNSLPVAGKTGTLEKRLKGTKAEGVVHAKTGYLNFARSLSGYTSAADGEPLAFVMFTNNYTVPTSLVDNAEELVLMYLGNFRRH